MTHKKYLVWFDEVDKEDVGLVGGKGANLGEMINANLPVPYGFVVTSHAYFYFIREAKLQHKINEILSIVNYDNPPELQQASEHIQGLILKASVPHDLTYEIVKYYDDLVSHERAYYYKKYTFLHHTIHKLTHLYNNPLVAVRSSATAEDLPNASFAGQQETYLNVKGESHLLQKVKECWASLFTERAIYYRHEQGFDHFKVGLAAVVQRMVQSEKSGIAFSIDPVSNDKNKIVIEAVYGLGEYIVQGKVTPDHYEVDKNSFIITNIQKAYQNVKFIKSGVHNIEVKLNHKEGSQQKLTEQEILKVAMLVKDIEKHYFFPQDIEWAIENGKVFIVQSRPITTIKQTTKKSEETGTVATTEMPILTGSPASPGIGVGHVSIIMSPKDIGVIKQGDILVAPQTNPDYVPAMKKAAAIVTEKGGRTSHAAIVSRELGIPAVVGAENATKVLKNDMVVSVNGQIGEIYKGSILDKSQTSQPKKVEEHHPTVKTLTKVYVNLAEPEQAEKVAKMDVDGVGLLRAEFMIAEIGTHPKEFIRQKRSDLFVQKLTTNLHKFVDAFAGRPIVYRATDFKSNEYKNLKGGRLYEPEEENPMLGYRGASRYVADTDVFGLELEAIHKIWEMGYKNLHLMIPFVRVPWELIRIREIVTDYGLLDKHKMKLWMMVEVPAAAIMLKEFINVGIDGVSIGTNDLTMMLLGVDRDSAQVSHIYDERNQAVVSTLDHIVETCIANGITCSICGQAASDFPEIVERLVKRGITSVSVNPDAVNRTRAMIYDLEKKIHKR